VTDSPGHSEQGYARRGGPSYRIAVIKGDGIGPEVVAEAVKVLHAATPDGLALHFEEVEAGARCYERTGEDLPRETLEVCQAADAILFGSAGLPDVRFPDGTEIAPQLTLRVTLDLYVGLRPIRLYPGAPTALRLADGARIDYVILRENTEGLYASRGAGVRVGGHVATDTLVITRQGTARICREAFELARRRAGAPLDGRRRVTCVDKANVLKSYAFFRDVFDQVAGDYPEVEATHVYVDAMAAYLVQAPGRFDVVVMENMFGDILSDLAAATVGGLGMAPSGDIGDQYALFQPSHGTAPDIAGKGIANPVATILSAGLMLDWLGRHQDDPGLREAALRIDAAVSAVLATGHVRTPDLGGDASTAAMGDAVAGALPSSAG
jgi:3-isopropylmalate dehydrogenase